MLDVPSTRNPEGVDALVVAWQTRRCERSIAALLKQYDRFLIGESRRWALRYRLDIDDARQVANLAFVRAVEKFDGAHQASLLHYAKRWIQSRVMRMVPNRGAVDQPTSWTTDRYVIARCIRQMKAEGIQQPTPEDIASRLDGYGAARIRAVLQGTSFKALDAFLPGSDDMTAGDLLEAPDSYRPDVQTVDGLTLNGAREAIDAALATLSERQREVAIARFWGDETLQQVGDRIGLTRERVRQIEAQALTKMGKLLGDDMRVMEMLAG